MPRAPNKVRLTDLYVTNLKPQERAYLVWDLDAEGLALCVQPTGRKSWKAIYAFHGRTRWYTIGKCNATIGLAEARRRAKKVLLQVADDTDPQANRMAGRSAGTFEELARRYLVEFAQKRNKSWRQGEKLIRRHVLPLWGKLRATDITRSDARRLFAGISAPILANQVLAAVGAVFSWAIKNEVGQVTANPCTGIEKNPTKKRERVLSDAEVAQFWPKLNPALKLILLSGQRPGEVEHMHPDHIAGGWWTLPGAPVAEINWPGTKNGQSHRLWLSEPVQALLPELFASRRKRLDAAMKDICAELEAPRATPHDLRRTFSSAVTRLGFGRDAMNRVTNHREGGISDVYDQYEYADENRKIMETVARHFVALAEGGAGDRGNVVEIRKAATT
jgi:integrase